MKPLLTILFFILLSRNTFAANWNATLSNKFQADNRISNQSSYSAEVWGTYNYHNLENKLSGAFDFLTRAVENVLYIFSYNSLLIHLKIIQT